MVFSQGVNPMRRRDFLGIAVCTAAIVWSHLSSAQHSGKLPIIGFIGATPAMWAPWTGAFVDRLKTLGWIDGQTVNLEFRWSEGRPELATQFAQEFAKLNPSVIVAGGTSIPALKKATSTIPVVFFALDPLGAGVVRSLAQPGGNMTGISLQTLDAANKRFELLREISPKMRRLAIIADAVDPQTMLERNTVRELASKFGIDPIPLEIRRTQDIEPAFATLKSEQADALYVVINELLNANRLLIVSSAESARLPAIYGTRDWVRSGGLISYGPNFPSLFGRLAEITDSILRGAKPENTPVEQPTRFELVINLKTAEALSLTVPPTLLALANEVIE